MVKQSKDYIIRKINYLKVNDPWYSQFDKQYTKFMECLYYVSPQEIDSTINEVYTILKNEFIGRRNIPNDKFLQILKETAGWIIIETLVSYNTQTVFNGLTENQINKFFYILEENKSRLDHIKLNNKYGRFSMWIKRVILLFTDIPSTTARLDIGMIYIKIFFISQLKDLNIMKIL